MALSPYASGAELAMCQRFSRRIADKDGADGKVAAAGSSSEREQMCGGDPQRWNRPNGEDRTEMKKKEKEAEMHLAPWTSTEYREEVHDNI